MTKETLKEFDKKFGKNFEIKSEPENYIHRGIDPSFDINNLKSFIKRVLEAKEKEVKEDIIKNIEGMKKEIPQFRGTLKQLDNLTNLIKK